MRKFLLGGLLALFQIYLVSCDSDKLSSDAYRFEHVDMIASDYAKILSRATDEAELQYMLLDMRSKMDRLNDAGEESLALFFKFSVMDKVYTKNHALADSMFKSLNRRTPFI